MVLIPKIPFFPSRKGANRYLTVRKKDGSEITHATHAVMTCFLALSTKNAIWNLIQRFPVTSKERTELLPKMERGNARAVESGMFSVSLIWTCESTLLKNTPATHNLTTKQNPSFSVSSPIPIDHPLPTNKPINFFEF